MVEPLTPALSGKITDISRPANKEEEPHGPVSESIPLSSWLQGLLRFGPQNRRPTTNTATPRHATSHPISISTLEGRTCRRSPRPFYANYPFPLPYRRIRPCLSSLRLVPGSQWRRQFQDLCIWLHYPRVKGLVLVRTYFLKLFLNHDSFTCHLFCFLVILHRPTNIIRHITLLAQVPPVDMFDAETHIVILVAQPCYFLDTKNFQPES